MMQPMGQPLPEKPPRDPRTRTRRLFPRRRKFIAVLLAAICPGLGHIYLGLFRKGIAFMLVLLLDASALLYFSSIGMQINVPLLILLGLIIPATYFYNVYDVLQAADYVIALRKRKAMGMIQSKEHTGRNPFMMERSLFFGFLLIVSGALMVLFYQKPKWLKLFINEYGGLAAAAVTMILGLVFIIYRKRKLRVGRYTAALLLLVTGALLLIDSLHETEYLLLLLRWWPVLIVVWGLEYIIVFSVRRAKKQSGFHSKLDIKGMLMAVILAASIFIVTEQAHYLHLWNKVSLNLTAAGVDYSEQEGKHVDKGMIDIPVTMETKDVSIESINGDILLQRGATDHIRVQPTVWVDQITGPEADEVAEDAGVEFSEGAAINIQTKGKAYGQSGKRQPRVNLTITLPEDRRFDFSVRTMNGNIKLQNVEAIKTISLETANGEIRLNDVLGDVKGKTLNGKVLASNMTGAVDLSTNRGNIEVMDVSDAAKLNTQVGNLLVIRVLGDIDVQTKNGNIYVNQAKGKLKAESLNGGITVRSKEIGGDWDIYSAVGELNMSLPELGDYEIDGTIGYGDIRNAIPQFMVDKKKITGQIGTGEYSVRIEGNSDLNVKKY